MCAKLHPSMLANRSLAIGSRKMHGRLLGVVPPEILPLDAAKEINSVGRAAGLPSKASNCRGVIMEKTSDLPRFVKKEIGKRSRRVAKGRLRFFLPNPCRKKK